MHTRRAIRATRPAVDLETHLTQLGVAHRPSVLSRRRQPRPPSPGTTTPVAFADTVSATGEGRPWSGGLLQHLANDSGVIRLEACDAGLSVGVGRATGSNRDSIVGKEYDHGPDVLRTHHACRTYRSVSLARRADRGPTRVVDRLGDHRQRRAADAAVVDDACSTHEDWTHRQRSRRTSVLNHASARGSRWTACEGINASRYLARDALHRRKCSDRALPEGRDDRAVRERQGGGSGHPLRPSRVVVSGRK